MPCANGLHENYISITLFTTNIIGTTRWVIPVAHLSFELQRLMMNNDDNKKKNSDGDQRHPYILGVHTLKKSSFHFPVTS